MVINYCTKIQILQIKIIAIKQFYKNNIKIDTSLSQVSDVMVANSLMCKFCLGRNLRTIGLTKLGFKFSIVSCGPIIWLKGIPTTKTMAVPMAAYHGNDIL